MIIKFRDTTKDMNKVYIMKIYYNLFIRPIEIAPYFRGLQKIASLEQLENRAI